MAIYEKGSGPDDVMTFCGEEKPMGKGFCELYEFPKLVIATTNYTNYTNFQDLSLRLRITRILRISKTCLYDVTTQIYEFKSVKRTKIFKNLTQISSDGIFL